MIQFLLDDELIQVDGLPAQTSVLDFLRTHLGRTGTKEGCASGIAAPVPSCWPKPRAKPCVTAR